MPAKNPAPAHRLTGTRIRERRLARGIRQGDLARQVGISPAYLNLIEHNRRRIAGKLLMDIARALGAEPAELSEGAEAALLGVLSAAGARQPDSRAELDRLGELAGRFPGWARLIAAQHGRIRALERLVEALSDRLSHDPQLAATLHELISSVTAIRSAVSILSDEGEVDPEWQARFLRNVAEDAARLTEAAQGLVGVLETGARARATHLSPQEELSEFLERHGYAFAALEPGAGAGADEVAVLAGEVAGEAARDLAQTWLARYRRDAAAMPAAEFARRWEETGHDPARMATLFGTDMAAVLRRAACRPGAAPAGLVICDATGTFTTRRPLPGFSVPRFGAACPRWPLYQALTQPGRAIRQVVEMPGDTPMPFTAVAIAQSRFPNGLEDMPVIEATMLIEPRAGGTEAAGAALAVGPGCRVCPRGACPARREASLLALT